MAIFWNKTGLSLEFETWPWSMAERTNSLENLHLDLFSDIFAVEFHPRKPPKEHVLIENHEDTLDALMRKKNCSTSSSISNMGV